MNVASSEKPFLAPSAFEAFANRCMGFLARRGLAPSYMVELEVRGRKSGTLYRTPVNVLELDGTTYLVCPRGEAAWVKNARAANEVSLRRGSSTARYALSELANEQKPAVLAEYLLRYKAAVQRYFPVPAGSGAEAMREVARHYPVFRITKI